VSNDVSLVACADPAIERARALAARVPGARAVADHRELHGSIDLAIVATTNAAHEPVALDLLGAGVHVLVEKPMARTADACRRMCAAAESSGAVLAVGHDFRFFPVAQATSQLLSSGALGAIHRVDVKQSAGVRWPCVSPAALTRECGGGVVISFGVHTLDLLRWWLGELAPVVYRDDAMGGVESECECELVSADGVPLHVEISRRRSLRDSTIFDCERGRVEVSVFDPAFIRMTMAPGTPPLEANVNDPEFDRAPLRTTFARQLSDVVDAIRLGRQPLVDGQAGLRVVELVERCYAMREPLLRPWDYVSGRLPSVPRDETAVGV
jgi:predicted dehydrogenase